MPHRHLPTTKRAEKFLAQNPYFWGTMYGIDFYECPVHGDETYVKAIDETGEYRCTGYWDLPESEDDVAYMRKIWKTNK